MRDLKESACYRIYWEGVPNAEDRMNVSLGPGTRPRLDLNRESKFVLTVQMHYTLTLWAAKFD
jgi:hypothetical protein